ncbi:MAG: hypothetical protein EBW39_11040 [Betaproteobacteria bacterium]|nr:hypothetical protein [Betaproteobacteria bacterium]
MSVEHLAKHGMQGRGVLINLRDRLGLAGLCCAGKTISRVGNRYKKPARRCHRRWRQKARPHARSYPIVLSTAATTAPDRR